MNKRSSMILSMIMSAQNNINVNHLATTWKVPLSTIFTDLEGINDLLLSKDMEIIEIDKNGNLLFSHVGKITYDLMSEVDLYEHQLSKKERTNLIALKLLLSDNYIKMSELDNIFDRTFQSALNELPWVKNSLEKMKIEIKMRSDKGVMIVCAERDRRAAIFEILSSDLKKYGLVIENYSYKHIRESVINLRDYIEKIEDIIKISEKANCIFLSNDSFEKCVIFLSIATLRMERGNYITLPQLINEKLNSFSIDIMNRLYSDFNLKLMNGEIMEFVSFLGSLEFEKWMRPYDEYSNIEELLKEFIKKIFPKLLIDRDIDLKANLKAYLKADLKVDLNIDLKMLEEFIIRLYNRRVDTKFDQDIIEINKFIAENHRDIYERVLKNISLFNNHFKRTLNKNEISELTLFLSSWIFSQSNNKKLKAIFVTNDNNGLAQYFKVIFEKWLNLEIIVVTLPRFLADYINDSIDFIVSSIPIPSFGKETILIQKTPRIKDLINIQNRISHILLEKKNSKEYSRTLPKDRKNSHYIQGTINNHERLNNRQNNSANNISNNISDYSANNISNNISGYSTNNISNNISCYSANNILNNISDYSANNISKNNTNVSSPKSFENTGTLSSLIDHNNIILDVACANYFDAIRLSANALLKNGVILKPFVDKIMDIYQNDVENVVSGEGIAILYPKSDEFVLQSGISIIRLRNSVKFEKYSGNLVDMLIFLAIINEKDRLDVFYNLIYLLRFDSFKKNLRLAKSAEEIKSLIKEYETALNKGGLKSDMGRN